MDILLNLLNLLMGNELIQYAVGGLVALIGGFVWLRSRDRKNVKKGRGQVETEIKTNTTENVERGRKATMAATNEMRKGKAPEQVVRDNDDAWS